MLVILACEWLTNIAKIIALYNLLKNFKKFLPGNAITSRTKVYYHLLFTYT